MMQTLDEFLVEWEDTPERTKAAFLRLKQHLEAKPGVSLEFVSRPGITYSLRASHENQQDKPLFVLVDVIEDQPRWLSVCFYMEMIDDDEGLFIGCATTPPKSSPGNGQTGLASYYAHRFHGRKTASGERYNENALTAAHRSLPFGTRVRVINLKNNRAVTVRINDRGPFIKGRIIDVSYAAARKLKMVVDGIARVRVVKVDDPL
ncbi:MAG: septal ring lytic transglycosylase RlpA family protein [Desulfosarcinaceae bacterium]